MKVRSAIWLRMDSARFRDNEIEIPHATTRALPTWLKSRAKRNPSLLAARTSLRSTTDLLALRAYAIPYSLPTKYTILKHNVVRDMVAEKANRCTRFRGCERMWEVIVARFVLSHNKDLVRICWSVEGEMATVVLNSYFSFPLLCVQ